MYSSTGTEGQGTRGYACLQCVQRRPSPLEERVLPRRYPLQAESLASTTRAGLARLVPPPAPVLPTGADRSPGTRLLGAELVGHALGEQ